jgi:hypothetical protein
VRGSGNVWLPSVEALDPAASLGIAAGARQEQKDSGVIFEFRMDCRVVQVNPDEASAADFVEEHQGHALRPLTSVIMSVDSIVIFIFLLLPQ